MTQNSDRLHRLAEQSVAASYKCTDVDGAAALMRVAAKLLEIVRNKNHAADLQFVRSKIVL
jgi:hypothetical protein